MRSSTLLALPFLVAGACSAEHVGSQQQADTLTGSVYITQIFGGGGNSGAPYDHDYVVLTNSSSEDAVLSAYSLYYRSAGGTTWAATALPANLAIPAGGNYLVTEAEGSQMAGTALVGNTAGTISMSGTAGVVALATNATTTPDVPANSAGTVDLVGYGSATTLHEGAGPAPTPSNTTADIRIGTIGNNADDFTTGAPAPVGAEVPDMEGLDLEQQSAPDMVITDAGAFTAALNEVKWNPPKADDGQEFIELIGTGTLPPNTYVVSVSGDAEASVSTVGRINYAYDVSATAFGANGLILIKAAATTFPGVDATTNVLSDPNLNTAKLGNYTETTMLIQITDNSALPIVTGHQIPAASTYTVIDAIAVSEPVSTDGGVADPTYGPLTDVLPACASETPGKFYPPSGASRIVGHLDASTASAWYAGQAYGTVSTDQYLSNVADCSTGSGAPATWSMSPGLPNDMPAQAIPDLLNAPIIDLSTPSSDLATTIGADDLSANTPDLAHTSTGVTPVKPGSSIGGSGCATAGHGPIGWASTLIVVGLAALLRRRRIAA